MGAVFASPEGNYIWNPERQGTELPPYPVRVREVDGKAWCLWVEYANGESGEVDLSALIEKKPFRRWRTEEGLFQTVRIEGDTLVWDQNIDIAPETVYMAVTGKALEDFFPVLRVG